MIADFDKNAIKIRRRVEPFTEYLAVQLTTDLRTTLPDKFRKEKVVRTIEEVEITFHPKTGKKQRKVNLKTVEDEAPTYIFDETADSCSHGGFVSANAGDWLVKDGDDFFVVKHEEPRTKRPIFWDRYERI